MCSHPPTTTLPLSTLDPTSIEVANPQAPFLPLGPYSSTTTSPRLAPDQPTSVLSLLLLGPPHRCCHDTLLPPLDCHQRQIQSTMKSRILRRHLLPCAYLIDIVYADVAATDSRPSLRPREVRTLALIEFCGRPAQGPHSGPGTRLFEVRTLGPLMPPPMPSKLRT
eukprot:g35400.t1